jgi:two-component system, response regulator PdtaR
MSHETFNSRGLKVLIVEDDTLVGLGLKAHLERLGHVVVGQAASTDEAMRLYREQRPDLVLVDIRLNGDDGIDLAGQLMEERRAPIIMISAYSDPELINRASSAGIFGYLVKPFSFETLVAQIEVAAKRFREREQLIQDRDEAIQNLETRKLVERAKGIFMKRLSLSEPDAHRRLQLESQRRRISLAELAKKVIESDELW